MKAIVYYLNIHTLTHIQFSRTYARRMVIDKHFCDCDCEIGNRTLHLNNRERKIVIAITTVAFINACIEIETIRVVYGFVVVVVVKMKEKDCIEINVSM